MNDNDLSMKVFWARAFRTESPQSLLDALSVLGGLIDDHEPFLNVGNAIRVSKISRTAIMPASKIIFEVAEKHGLTIADLKGEGRKVPVAIARQEAFWRLRTELGLSYPRIGTIFNGRDHSTVIHGIRRHAARLTGDVYVQYRTPKKGKTNGSGPSVSTLRLNGDRGERQPTGAKICETPPSL
jgi:hypothetical protein